MQVIERADMLWSTKPAYKELKDRMSFVSGNFFVASTLLFSHSMRQDALDG